MQEGKKHIQYFFGMVYWPLICQPWRQQHFMSWNEKFTLRMLRPLWNSANWMELLVASGACPALFTSPLLAMCAAFSQYLILLRRGKEVQDVTEQDRAHWPYRDDEITALGSCSSPPFAFHSTASQRIFAESRPSCIKSVWTLLYPASKWYVSIVV